MTILERLRAATGPFKVHDANDLAYDAGFHGENYALMVAALRGGVDAVGSALALVDRMLPGAAYDLHKSDKGYSFSILRADLGRPYFGGATPALAILTALFAALEAKERT